MKDYQNGKDSWSLVLQVPVLKSFKNDKVFYDNIFYALVCIYDEEVIGLCSCYENDIFSKMIEVSFVVNKDYQGQGIGTSLLKRVEWDAIHKTSYEYITAKHYKDNIASHKAFLKAGYKEWTIDSVPNGDGRYFYIKNNDASLDFKVKKIK